MAYIYRDKAIAYVEEQYRLFKDDECKQAIVEGCVEALKFTPTADVVEVKHGEWIEDGYAEIPCVCSYCGEEAQYISKFNETFDYDWEENLQSTGYEETREYIRTPYCPNCGAKMDGGIQE